MANIEGLFKGTKAKTATATVCLRGDLVAEFAKLEAQLAQARERDEQTFAGGESREVIDRMNAIREEMTAAEVTIDFESMPPMRPLDVVAEHPPREDNKVDVALGYNQETYYPALIRESASTVTANDGTVAQADAISEDAWAAMLQGLGHQDFDKLVGAALEANGRTSVPFSHLASLISARNEDDSKQPSDGEPPPSDSTAGNPESKPSTSTTTPEDSPAP